MQAIYSLSPGDQYELVRRHHITSHLQQATPCSRHDTGSKLARRCSSSRGKQPELATLAAWSPLQEPQNTSCVGRRWKRETAAPARAGRAARRPVAAQASLDPSFLWMVVAPSRCGTPVGGGAAVAQVADAAEARGATRGFAASRFSGNFGHFSLLLAPPTVGAPRAGLGGAPRLPASSARAPARTALRPFSLLGSFGGLARSAPYLPPCIQSACKRAVTFVHARCERSTRRCTPSSSCVGRRPSKGAPSSSSCFTPCTCQPTRFCGAGPPTNTKFPSRELRAPPSERDDGAAGSLNHVLHLSARI